MRLQNGSTIRHILTCLRHLCFSLTLPPKKNSQSQSWTTWMSCEKKNVLADVDVPWLKWLRLKQVKIQHLTNCNTYYTDYTSPRLALLGSICSFFLGSKILQLSDFCGEFS